MPPRSSAAAFVGAPTTVAPSITAGEAAAHATVPEALAWWAGATPDALALSQANEELSYAELESLTEGLARRFAAAGAADAQRIVLMAENCIEWVVAFLAGLRAGAVIVPLNTRLGSDEVRPPDRRLRPEARSRDRGVSSAARGDRRTNRPRPRARCRSLLGVGPARRGRARRATTGRSRPHRLHVGDDRRAERGADIPRSAGAERRVLRVAAGDRRRRRHTRHGPPVPQHGLRRPGRPHAARRRLDRSPAGVPREHRAVGSRSPAGVVPDRGAEHLPPADARRGGRRRLSRLSDRRLRRLAHAGRMGRGARTRAGPICACSTATG